MKTCGLLLNYSSLKQNIVIPEMTSEVNSFHSSLFLGRERGKGQISHIKVTKTARTIIFRSGNQEKKEIYNSGKNVLGLLAL